MTSVSSVAEDGGRPVWAILALGAFAQLAQVLVFREILATCHGSEILFSLILASGMLWAALGSAAVTRLFGNSGDTILFSGRLEKSDGVPRIPDSARARAWLAATIPFNGLLCAGQILLARALAGWGSEAAGQALPLARCALLTLLVTAPGAFWAGAQFALALRSLPRGGFARAYRAESWGAVLGGLGFTFVLVYLFEPFRAALLCGAVLAAAAHAALRSAGTPPTPPYTKGGRTGAGPSRTWLLPAAALVLLAAGLLPLERPGEELRWRGLLPGYELLEWRDTPYGRVCALRRPGQSQVSLFHSGALAATLEPDAAPADARALADLCACLHPKPRRALLIGETLGAFPAELLRHGLERVDALELDPALLEMARRYGRLERESQAVRRTPADGRWFVQSQAATGEYDLVVVSAGVPDSAMSNRYCTAEFFRAAARALSGDGVLVLSLSTYGAGHEYLSSALARRSGSIWRALAEVFPEVHAAPVNGHLLAAAKRSGTFSFRPAALGERLAARPQAQPKLIVQAGAQREETPVPPADYFDSLFGNALAVQMSLDAGERQTNVEDLEHALVAAPVPVNRDGHPVAVAESLALGAEVSEGGAEGRADVSLAGVLRAWGPWTVGIPVGLGCLLAGFFALRGRRGARSSGPLLLVAFASGLFGMAVEVSLLAAYQNVRGYVYGEIGGIIACFMAGLALGAGWGERCRARPRRVLWRALAGALVFTLALPLAVDGLAWCPGLLAASGFWVLVFIAGFLDGIVFPPLVRCGASGSPEALSSAEGGPDGAEAREAHFGGRAYAWDLAGAALGALLCGAVWIPLFSLPGAMWAVSGVLLAALLALSSVPSADRT